MDILEIMQILKQRYPFLMVDRIEEYDTSHAIGYKNVSINEPFFEGHFPNEPVMPGVMILESMGQVASIMVGASLEKDKIAFLAGVDKARFRKPVRPGDKLVTKSEVIKIRSSSGKVKVTGYVDDEIVAEAEFLFVLGSTLEKKLEKNNKSEV